METEYRVSKVKVMHSNAGYYIGTDCEHTSGDCKGLVEPYERMSPYMSEYEANKYVVYYEG